jgi:hypothetical protein
MTSLAQLGSHPGTAAAPSITSQLRRQPLRIDQQRLEPDPSFEDPAAERRHRQEQQPELLG